MAVLGDSIAYGARAELAAELGDPWFVHVNAKSRDLYRDRFDEAEEIAATSPEVVVVHLGTNDWWCGFANVMVTAADCRYPEFVWEDEVPDAETMIATFPSETCLLLTQVWEAPGVVDPVNDLLESLVDEGAIDGYVPWQDYLLGLPEEDRALLLANDGIGHLTPEGSQALAETTRLAVDEHCPSL